MTNDNRMPDNEKRDKDEMWERFAKWQSITREQLSSTSNLMLGLATGMLAFTTALLLQHKSSLPLCVLVLATAASFLLALSVALALGCAINRLEDFRITAKISNPNHANNPDVEEWRKTSQCLGERTWKLFRGQLWSFAFGGGGAAIIFIIQLWSQ